MQTYGKKFIRVEVTKPVISDKLYEVFKNSAQKIRASYGTNWSEKLKCCGMTVSNGERYWLTSITNDPENFKIEIFKEVAQLILRRNIKFANECLTCIYRKDACKIKLCDNCRCRLKNADVACACLEVVNDNEKHCTYFKEK